MGRGEKKKGNNLHESKVVYWARSNFAWLLGSICCMSEVLLGRNLHRIEGVIDSRYFIAPALLFSTQVRMWKNLSCFQRL